MTDSTTSTDEEVLLATSPSIKPTLVTLALTLLVGSAAFVYLRRNPTALGNATDVIRQATVLLVAIVVVGLVGRVYVLTRTSYLVTADAVHRRFRFLRRRKERRLPLARVRATELDRGRIESLFGVGTLRFLTGGTNSSLGFVRFESIANPADVRDRLHGQFAANETSDDES